MKIFSFFSSIFILIFSSIAYGGDEKADILIFSFNRPLQLYACLESIEANISDQGNVYVLYRTSDSRYEKSYEEVKARFGDIEFFQQSELNPQQIFKPLVMRLAFNRAVSLSDYIVFCTDDIIIKDKICLSEGISLLQKTKAYGLFYRLGKNITYCYMNREFHKMPSFEVIAHESMVERIFSWKFYNSSGDFKYPNNVDFTLYAKNTIEKDLSELTYTSPNEMEGLWATRANHQKRGLCYEKSKIVNLPLNIVSEIDYPNRQSHYFTVEELQDKFEKGFKIDVNLLFQINNRSAHMDYKPIFIYR